MTAKPGIRFQPPDCPRPSRERVPLRPATPASPYFRPRENHGSKVLQLHATYPQHQGLQSRPSKIRTSGSPPGAKLPASSTLKIAVKPGKSAKLRSHTDQNLPASSRSHLAIRT